MEKIGVVGAGAMGMGIAQVAAKAGHQVVVYDQMPEARTKAANALETALNQLVSKEKITIDAKNSVVNNIIFATDYQPFAACNLVIEAVVENIEVKKQVFQNLENFVSDACILATNTSSLSVTSIAAACAKPERFVGLHFFNPATLMPLVEVIPALQSLQNHVQFSYDLMVKWGKCPVLAKDTPGFIVNRIARPYYGESIKILEENIASAENIDAAMRNLGFKMGPFELMDFIGHDVNYAVTQSVFAAFFFDRRYLPSHTQQRLVEAGYLGRKSNRGFYEYPQSKEELTNFHATPQTKYIQERILAMLINEACEAVYLQIANEPDIELAMTKGVNYPKGLFAWAAEKGYKYWLTVLQDLQKKYADTRYRPSILLQNLAE